MHSLNACIFHRWKWMQVFVLFCFRFDLVLVVLDITMQYISSHSISSVCCNYCWLYFSFFFTLNFYMKSFLFVCVCFSISLLHIANCSFFRPLFALFLCENMSSACVCECIRWRWWQRRQRWWWRVHKTLDAPLAYHHHISTFKHSAFLVDAVSFANSIPSLLSLYLSA